VRVAIAPSRSAGGYSHSVRLWLAGLLVAAAAAFVGAGCAPVLAAPPHLVAVWPAPNATLPVALHAFELTFNRSLRREETWAEVWRDEDGVPMATETVIDAHNSRRLRVNILEPAAGQYRLRWHAVSARTSATSDGEQVFEMQEESISAPRLQVSRVSADSGDRIQISGNGFGQECPVRLTIGDDEQALTTVETNAEGAFVIDTKVPPSVPFGLQPVAAVDVWGDSATAPLQVRWGGWPPLVAFTVGQPGPRAGEVTFSLSVRNRSDYLLEKVRVIMSDPDGATFVAAEPQTARQERALAWEIPMVDRGVVGPFRATFKVSGAVATHARIEFRHRRPHGCNGDDCLPAFVSETMSDSTAVYPAD
jgi:methionine-rich copper-binding protein CopC